MVSLGYNGLRQKKRLRNAAVFLLSLQFESELLSFGFLSSGSFLCLGSLGSRSLSGSGSLLGA